MGDSHAGHDHGYDKAPASALKWALVLTGGFMFAEAIAAWYTNSLALLSDAAHMLTDTAALAIALAALHIGKRKADERRTFGYARFEILAAAFNAVILFLAAMYILWEAIARFSQPVEIQSTVMMTVAALGAVVNLVSMRLLHAGSKSNLNMKGAYLEVWSDMLGSLGVLAGGAVIYFTGWQIVDPIIAVAISVWVLPRTWILLRDSFNILLEGVPAGLDVTEIETAILQVEGISGIHDLHVWALSSGKLLLTAHLEIDETNLPEFHAHLLKKVNDLLKSEFHIGHTTLQLEQVACIDQACTLNDNHTHH